MQYLTMNNLSFLLQFRFCILFDLHKFYASVKLKNLKFKMVLIVTAWAMSMSALAIKHDRSKPNLLKPKGI